MTTPPATPSAPGRPAIRRPPTPVLPVAFLTRAAALPGKTLAVALALCVLCANARQPTVVLGKWVLSHFSISPDAASDALTRLSDAGLIRTSRRRGRHATVTLLHDEVLRLAGADGRSRP